MVAIEFKNVDVIFGDAGKEKKALELLDQKQNREVILEKTGSVLGVSGASLKIPKNKICVLMGLSGSGKSSLLRCINGLNRITRGELWVDIGGVVKDGGNGGENGDGRKNGYSGKPVNIATARENELRDFRMHQCSMVFQQFGLLPWATVRENVSFGLKVKKLSKSVIDKIVEEKLEMVQLSSWADKSIHELSGGMQQRVGLARALATDTPILLMDEPFSALDPLIREFLQDELLELNKKLNKTIVFVSHDLNEALKIGDLITIMKDGKIVQSGSARDIVFNPRNSYVKDFITKINPLTTLNAGSLMKILEKGYSESVELAITKTVAKTVAKGGNGGKGGKGGQGEKLKLIMPEKSENGIKWADVYYKKKKLRLSFLEKAGSKKLKANEIGVVGHQTLLCELLEIMTLDTVKKKGDNGFPILVHREGTIAGYLTPADLTKALSLNRLLSQS